jgi:hypothetical protein
MKHLKRFNSINESHSQEDIVDIIIDSMRDFLDDDRKILFKSPIDDMRYQDYIDKNSNYLGFKPIVNTGSSIRGQFIIVFQDIKDYSDLLSVTNQMQSVFGRLKDEDWTMYDMKIGTTPPQNNQGDVRFTFLSFYFSKPDQKLEEEFKWPDEEDLKKAFDKYGLSNLYFDYYRPSNSLEPIEVTIEFDSNSYNGRVSNSIEELFELICNRFGFNSYNYNSGDYKVTFTI